MNASQALPDRAGQVPVATVTASERKVATPSTWTSRALVLAAVRDPARLRDLPLEEWDILVRAARAANVFSNFAVRAQVQELTDVFPAAVRPHLEAARILAERHQIETAWETDRIDRALRPLQIPVVLLKGAAYQAIGLPTAAGRLTVDVDVLVPRERLADVEQTLMASGWRVAPRSPDDQIYFRRWMHELPPLVHHRRRTVVDVHHTIVPPTDRLVVDARLLIEASLALPGHQLRVLAPVDLFLHSAAHLFRNGRWGQGFRDLLDMDAMVRSFGGRAGFWDELQTRAGQLNLGVPAAAALRALTRHLGTPVPPPVLTRMAVWRPVWPLAALFDSLVDRALLPRLTSRPDHVFSLAQAVLSYWPLPRLAAMRTAIFWTKRLRKSRTDPTSGPMDTATISTPDPED